MDDTNTSGQLTLDFQANPRLKAYATYATAFKPVGMNVGGLPTDAANNPILASAVIKPEDVAHVEGILRDLPVPRDLDG